MTEKEKTIDRIRKLLALSKSANVNESAAAAAQAQKLMAEHAITQAIVEVFIDEPEEDIADDILNADGSTVATWKGILGVALCRLNQCKAYKSSGSLHIIGRPSKANTVRYLFAYITREISRLCVEEGSLRGKPGRTWNNNFRMGAASVVIERLEKAEAEARAEARQNANQGDTLGNGVALARIDGALVRIEKERREIDAWATKHLHLRRSACQARADHGGREAGERAGARINLDSGRGLDSGNRKSLTR